MGGEVLQNVLLFLIDTVLSLYSLAFLLRFLFAWAQVDFYNPLSQTLIKLTQPPIDVASKLVPSFGNVDLASCLLAYLLKVLAFFLIGSIQGPTLPLGTLLALGAFKLADTIILIYMFSLAIVAISSWFMSGIQAFNHPLISLLYSLNAPIVTRIRRFVPTVGVIDFSLLVAFISLYVLRIVLRSFM